MFYTHTDGKKVPLVAISGTHTLLLSAYLEHRTAIKQVSEERKCRQQNTARVRVP